MSVLVTGSTGFIGQNLIVFFEENNIGYQTISLRNENFELSIATEVVIHLAGKAHDVKNVADEAAYYQVNTELTKKLYDKFLLSNAKKFIYLSSIKAVADRPEIALGEGYIPQPNTAYGKSKLLAEQYLLENQTNDKKVFILRPCMVHGLGNKGNLNLLFHFVKRKIPYPLGAFENQRSFLSIDNLIFIISELLKNETIPTGTYHLADDEPLSTNQVVKLMYNVMEEKEKIWYLSPKVIRFVAQIGDVLKLPINSERIKKLTENYVVTNYKIKKAIGKEFPFTVEEGLRKTIKSFI